MKRQGALSPSLVYLPTCVSHAGCIASVACRILQMHEFACHVQGWEWGAPRYMDGHGAADSLRSADNASFKWCVGTAFGEWQFEVSVRCDNAVQRGVPRPKAWPHMVRCAIADAVARDASASTSFGTCVSDIDCTFLGGPVRANLRAGDNVGAGSVVSLKSDCTPGRRWYLIVAHVVGDLWLCADGSIGGGEELTLDRLFADDALQLKKPR